MARTRGRQREMALQRLLPALTTRPNRPHTRTHSWPAWQLLGPRCSRMARRRPSAKLEPTCNNHRRTSTYIGRCWSICVPATCHTRTAIAEMRWRRVHACSSVSTAQCPWRRMDSYDGDGSGQLKVRHLRVSDAQPSSTFILLAYLYLLLNGLAVLALPLCCTLLHRVLPTCASQPLKALVREAR